MNDKNSLFNQKKIRNKNILSKKNKYLNQNSSISYNKEYNKNQFKQGKTAQSSPIYFRNKITKVSNVKKTDINIPSIVSKHNKNYTFDNNKSNSRSKSKSRKSSKKKSKEQSRNIFKDNKSKFRKLNFNEKTDLMLSKNHLKSNVNTGNRSNNILISITQNNSNIQTKNKINKQRIKKEKKNKILQRNLLFNYNNISNNNNISKFNLITANKVNNNLKVMKIINNILAKKKKNKTAINSRKNTSSKEKKNSKNKNIKTGEINRIKNLYNNNKMIKNLKKSNNIINNIKLKQNKNSNVTNIIRNISIFSNNINKYQNLIDKYSNKTLNNNKLKKNNNYLNLKSDNFTLTSNNIKVKNTNFNNKQLIKKRSEHNSKSKENASDNLQTVIYNKKNIFNTNMTSNYNYNFNLKNTYKSFPLTTTHSINIAKTKNNIEQKNKKKSKSSTKTNNSNIYTGNKKSKTKYNFNKKQNNKSKSNSKNKKRNKSSNKYKEFNNIYMNRYSTNKNQKNIININIIYNNKKNKIEKNQNVNKKNEYPKRNNPNVNNFIINIFQNKSTYPGTNIDFQKTIKNINLTTSEIHTNSKENKYSNSITKKSKKQTNSHSIKKYKPNNNDYLNEDLPIIINNKDSYYYNEISKKLSEKIKQYGKEHNYLEYPKTDLSFYKIGRSIGHGAFGKVNIALHVLSGHIVSIKSFNKKKNLFSLNRIKNEVKIMNKLRKSDNIVKLFELFETKNYYCLVMENVVGGSLLSAINKMNKIPENISKNIFKQLITTLQFIHSHNIVHRDIKPDNILLDLDNTIKLCDFGVSKIIPKGQLVNDSCGTPAFIAPEILLDTPYNPYVSDIWSSGVVLYAMVTGFFPFRGVNETQLHENILSGLYPNPLDISEDLKDLLKRILNVNPKERITLEQILEHPWLNKDNNNNNYYKNKDFNINLFTKAEKIIYGKLKMNYKSIPKDIQLENFTNKNIDSYYEEENQNVQTMSFIFTPYNTNRVKEEDEDLYYDDVNIEDKIMNFNPKVQEINRLYEIHNNYEYDQGYIIEKKEILRKKLKVSIKNSFENDNNNNNSNNRISKKKDIFDENNNLLKINVSMNTDNFILNEEAIKYVENFGYKKEYIIKSLEGNELNHATATYYLRLSLKNSKN